MEKKVSPTNTKTEIFEAYNELLKQMENQPSGQPKEVKEKEERDNTVKTAISVNKEGIIKQIANLKLSLNADLEKVEDALVSESKKLTQVQAAITIQEQRLKDLYTINATADSVSAMLTLQKEKKEAFEKEIEQKRIQFDDEISTVRQKWEKDKSDSETLAKEEKDRLQKQRKRDEEEYAYNMELSRKKDTDQYELKKQILTKELADKKNSFEQEIKSREQAVIEAEQELIDLRTKAASYPKLLEQSIKEAVTESTEKLQTTYKYETQLKAKEYESDVKLRDQDIANLKSKIKDLEIQLVQFATKADQADKSAKDIAIKAIESSQNIRVVERTRDTKEDAAK